jgi:DNA-directed RNA polymerase specialized sigma24 family protein
MPGTDSPDLDTFNVYVTAHGPELVYLARALLRDPYRAEDVVQRILAAALVDWRPDTCVGDLDTQVRWRLVKACVSWRRHFVRRDHVHRSRDLGQMCDSEIVVALLHQLPMRQRTVLVLRHQAGMSDADIARALHTSVATVRVEAR